jgi:hypothetical protein
VTFKQQHWNQELIVRNWIDIYILMSTQIKPKPSQFYNAIYNFIIIFSVELYFGSKNTLKQVCDDGNCSVSR